MNEYKHYTYFVQQTEDECVAVEIMFNRADNLYHFVNLTKGHICHGGFETVELAVADMEEQKTKGNIIDYERIVNGAEEEEQKEEYINEKLYHFLALDEKVREKYLKRTFREIVQMSNGTTAKCLLYGTEVDGKISIKIGYRQQFVLAIAVASLNFQWTKQLSTHKDCDIATLWECFSPLPNKLSNKEAYEKFCKYCFRLAALNYQADIASQQNNTEATIRAMF